MNGLLKRLFLLIAVISLPISVSNFIAASTAGNEMPEQEIKIFFQSNDVVSRQDTETIEKEIRKALNKIPPILGIEYKRNIQVKISDNGICNAEKDIISVPILHVRDRSAAIIHEATHIMANHESNSFFSEGLAVYFQVRFSEFHVFPNYSLPLDDFVRSHQDRLLPITKLNNDKIIFEQIGTDQRRMAYIEAGSFINFLVERYGEQKLAELNNSSSLNYKKIYGIGIEELALEWKNYVLRPL